jgi:hypothetical protein
MLKNETRINTNTFKIYLVSVFSFFLLKFSLPCVVAVAVSLEARDGDFKGLRCQRNFEGFSCVS